MLNLIVWIIVGALIGTIAGSSKSTETRSGYTLLGVIGACLGAFLLTPPMVAPLTAAFSWPGLAFATLSASAILVIAGLFRPQL